MTEVKNWAFSVCCSAVIGTILSMILPAGSLNKTFKTVFYVFFLCTVLSPLSEIKFSDYIGVNKFNNNIEFNETKDINSSMAKYLENKIVSSSEEVLNNEGIFYEDIFIKINIRDNESIDINKFELTIKNPEDASKIKSLIYEKIGIEPEIILSGENKNG